MYCKNCAAEINEKQAICVKCGFKNGDGNSFCYHCGKEINPQAQICLNCGMAIKSKNNFNKPQSTNMTTKEIGYKKLSEDVKNSAIVWFVVAGLQILVGLFLYWTPILVGAWNIYGAITRLKYSQELQNNPDGVYEYFEKQGTQNIIFLIVNALIGGIIGIIGALYDMHIRKYVLQNREIFD